jgi:hypothetical protein
LLAVRTENVSIPTDGITRRLQERLATSATNDWFVGRVAPEPAPARPPSPPRVTSVFNEAAVVALAAVSTVIVAAAFVTAAIMVQALSRSPSGCPKVPQ